MAFILNSPITIQVNTKTGATMLTVTEPMVVHTKTETTDIRIPIIANARNTIEKNVLILFFRSSDRNVNENRAPRVMLRPAKNGVADFRRGG